MCLKWQCQGLKLNFIRVGNNRAVRRYIWICTTRIIIAIDDVQNRKIEIHSDCRKRIDVSFHATFDDSAKFSRFELLTQKGRYGGGRRDGGGEKRKMGGKRVDAFPNFDAADKLSITFTLYERSTVSTIEKSENRQHLPLSLLLHHRLSFQTFHNLNGGFFLYYLLRSE